MAADISTADVAAGRQFTSPDVAARTGLFIASFTVGASFQPNLLTRSTRDQALITGLGGAVAYGFGSAGHSLLKSLGRRVPLGDTAVADVACIVGGVAVIQAFKAEEHEPNKRAIIRLGGRTIATLGAATLASRIASRATAHRSGKVRMAATAIAAGKVAALTFVALKPKNMRFGSDIGGANFEDKPKTVNPKVAVPVSVGVLGALVGVAHFESYISHLTSRGAAWVFGGDPADHKTFGRVVTYGATFFAGKLAMAKLTHMLTVQGEGLEAAHQVPPTAPEITGSPASGIRWSTQSRESRRWLTEALTPSIIESVMQEPGKQPIRVYASTAGSATDEERVAVLLSELERTNAYDRKVLALFSATGSGYVNYVASETLEFLTRGDCASACIEYSVLPSALSLNLVPLGTRQTRLVVDGIVQRLLAMKPEDRPQFVLFGESLGSQVSQAMFVDEGVDGLKAVALDSAVWIGTPSASKWRKQLWGDRSIIDIPTVGPQEAYLPRSILDWHELPQSEKDKVRYLLLQNADDPIPKFGSDLAWKQPDWLGPYRPYGSPQGTIWVPILTFIMTFFDMLNALAPTPGIFAEGGHDYRVEIPEALRQVWRLEATDEQMARVQKALRTRELSAEVGRNWDEAEAIEDPKKRAQAEKKVEVTVAQWTREASGEAAGPDATPEEIEAIIKRALDPE